MDFKLHSLTLQHSAKGKLTIIKIYLQFDMSCERPSGVSPSSTKQRDKRNYIPPNGSVQFSSVSQLVTCVVCNASEQNELNENLIRKLASRCQNSESGKGTVQHIFIVNFNAIIV